MPSGLNPFIQMYKQIVDGLNSLPSNSVASKVYETKKTKSKTIPKNPDVLSDMGRNKFKTNKLNWKETPLYKVSIKNVNNTISLENVMYLQVHVSCQNYNGKKQNVFFRNIYIFSGFFPDFLQP